MAVSRPSNTFWEITLFEYLGCIFGKFCQICSENIPDLSVVNNINKYGIPDVHRDGVQFIYEKDNAGNVIEYIDRPSVN